MGVLDGKEAGGNGGQIGNPAFVPTDEQRAEVRTLAKVISNRMIADMMNIGLATLYRHFKVELAEGKREAATKVGAMILTKALNGNLTAGIFYAKTQMGWSEHYTMDDGDAPPENPETDETLAKLIGLLVQAASDRKPPPDDGGAAPAAEPGGTE